MARPDGKIINLCRNREPSTVSARWFVNPNQGCVATFLVVFGAHMNISLIVKVTILVLVKRSYKSFLIRLSNETRMVSIC